MLAIVGRSFIDNPSYIMPLVIVSLNIIDLNLINSITIKAT